MWLQRTDDLGHKDYWYAFAGFGSRSPAEWADFEPVPPTVTSLSPADGETGRGTSTRPAAYFDTDVAGVNGATFTLTDSFGFAVPATVSWRADLRKATLTPATPLITKEWYTARLSGGVVSPTGGALAPVEWRFRTKDVGGDGSSATWPAGRSLTVGHGTHSGYQFDASGSVTAVLTDTLPAAASLTTTTRRSVPGQSGTWFHVTDGTWAGYWLRQSEVVHLTDEPASASATTAAYDPPEQVKIRRGTHTGYQFDATGLPTAEKTRTKSRAKTADVSVLQAIVNQSGTWFRVRSGTWDGYWLRSSDVVTLTGS
jgi:hypothetical protein